MGGVCSMINKKWCDLKNISILSCSCSLHLKHLSIICRPFYLPREISSLIVTAVYISPQADTSLDLSKLHDVLNGYINKHPVDWDMFRASSSDVSEFTDVAISYVNMLSEQATETVTIRTFSNPKPWVDRTIRDVVTNALPHTTSVFCQET